MQPINNFSLIMNRQKENRQTQNRQTKKIAKNILKNKNDKELLEFYDECKIAESHIRQELIDRETEKYGKKVNYLKTEKLDSILKKKIYIHDRQTRFMNELELAGDDEIIDTPDFFNVLIDDDL